MRHDVRQRFWFEAGLAFVSGSLCALTLGWHDWIEAAFGVNPDSGSGQLEWTLTAAFVVASAACALTARREWRRPAVD